MDKRRKTSTSEVKLLSLNEWAWDACRKRRTMDGHQMGGSGGCAEEGTLVRAQSTSLADLHLSGCGHFSVDSCADVLLPEPHTSTSGSEGTPVRQQTTMLFAKRKASTVSATESWLRQMSQQREFSLFVIVFRSLLGRKPSVRKLSHIKRLHW